jgi:hypothetical protein
VGVLAVIDNVAAPILAVTITALLEGMCVISSGNVAPNEAPLADICSPAESAVTAGIVVPFNVPPDALLYCTFKSVPISATQAGELYMATSAVPVGNGTVTVPLVGQVAFAAEAIKHSANAERMVLRIGFPSKLNYRVANKLIPIVTEFGVLAGVTE